MIQLTKKADYGMVILAHFASCSQLSLHSAREISQATQLPLPMVAKVLKILSKAGLLVSRQGPRGGYELIHKPEEISVAHILEALDGPLALTKCSSKNKERCKTESCCTVRGHWAAITQTIRTALDRLTLATMIDQNWMALHHHAGHLDTIAKESSQ